MQHASDDDVIHMLNNGRVSFTKMNNSDEKLPSFGGLYVRVTLRTGDQESTRDLYLKGQVMLSDNQGILGTQKLKPQVKSLIPPENENNPEQEQNTEVTVPLFSNFEPPSAKELRSWGIHFKDAKSHAESRSGNIHFEEARSHAETELYHCIHCNKKWHNTRKFLCHMKTHHGEGFIPCKICGKKFKTVGSHHKHKLMEHKGSRGLRSKMLNKEIFNKCTLEGHVNDHSKEALSLYSQCTRSQHLDSQSHINSRQEISHLKVVSHSMIQSSEQLNKVDQIKTEYSIEPKIEVKGEQLQEEDFYEIEQNVEIKEEMDI